MNQNAKRKKEKVCSMVKVETEKLFDDETSFSHLNRPDCCKVKPRRNFFRHHTVQGCAKVG